MNFAASDGEASKRAGIIVFNPLNLQHALAHGRHRAHISDLLALDGLEDLLRIEPLVKKHGSPIINNAQGKRAASVKIYRRSQKRPVVDSKPFLDSVIDAMKDKGSMCRQASLGKARRPRS